MILVPQCLKELLSGIGQRVRLENSLQLQKQKLVRPKQIKMEVATIYKDIADQLGDPTFKAIYDSIIITVPE